MRRICVFCGSNLGVKSAYEQAAQKLGKALAQSGIELVYGGGSVGLMGAIADATLAAGGRVMGVIPEVLMETETVHPDITQLYIVKSLHDRKALMTKLADAFIVLPGGYETVEALCEVLSWSQLNLHQKPLGLLNIDGYYDLLLTFFNQLVEQKFIKASDRSLILQAEEPRDLLELLTLNHPVFFDQWMRQPIQFQPRMEIAI